MTNAISLIQNQACPSINPFFLYSVENPSKQEELSFACQGIYKKSNKKTCVRRKWNNDDDSLLMSLVSTNEKQNWSSIAKNMKGKVGKQCRERWFNHLRPYIKKDAWDEKEDMILVKYHKIFGNRWAMISKFIEGRTNNSIKNHFNAAIKKLFKRKYYNRAGNQTSPVLQDYLRSLYECNTTSTSNTVIGPSASLSSVSLRTSGNNNVAESSTAHYIQDVASNEPLPSTILSSSDDDETVFMNNICQYVDQMMESFEWMEDV